MCYCFLFFIFPCKVDSMLMILLLLKCDTDHPNNCFILLYICSQMLQLELVALLVNPCRIQIL